MLANVADGALVYILGAVGALVARGARADEAPRDGRGVAEGLRVAGVAGTGVVQVTEEASLDNRRQEALMKKKTPKKA